VLPEVEGEAWEGQRRGDLPEIHWPIPQNRKAAEEEKEMSPPLVKKLHAQRLARHPWGASQARGEMDIHRLNAQHKVPEDRKEKKGANTKA
jgi:hypothetical protein